MSTDVKDKNKKRVRISENALEATTLPLKDRVAYIRKKKWFGYTLATSILDTLEDLLDYPKSPRMPNMLIVGDTNNGKTSLVLEFLKNHPSDDNLEGDNVKVPVFYMQAPPVPDESRFYDEILEILFAPYRTNEKIAKKESEVLRLFRLIDVKMLIIDEIHNILAGPMNRMQALLNAINKLGNTLQIPIVGVGTNEAVRAIHSDPQLANRFRSVGLPRWDYSNDYLRLLSTFEYTLALKEPSRLTEKTMAMELLRMSEGSIGEVATIISEAAVFALRQDQEHISLDTLKKINWTLPSRRSKAI